MGLHGVLMVVAVVLAGPGQADEPRVCYKCRAKDRCLSLDKSSLDTCNPDVKFCVKKQTLSRVTGAVVTERYCGGQDFLDSGKDLVEEKCYADLYQENGRRTSATICYCSYNLCNSAPLPSCNSILLGLSVLILVAMVVL
ncbi:uncharacterized protein [Procambarus clarkii]|uniref:uncharacterized protein n=1 Tax=Procambarus clarkii TaxID=6728 RepID=UPI003743E705